MMPTSYDRPSRFLRLLLTTGNRIALKFSHHDFKVVNSEVSDLNLVLATQLRYFIQSADEEIKKCQLIPSGGFMGHLHRKLLYSFYMVLVNKGKHAVFGQIQIGLPSAFGSCLL